MIVEGYIEFIDEYGFGFAELRGGVTASSYPDTKAGTIYYSSDTSRTGVIFYKYQNQNWTLTGPLYEEPGYQRFLWLTDYGMNTAPTLSPEQLDAIALEKYEVIPLSMNTQYYWSLYNPTTPLATPTGLTADQITSTGARIGWNAVANASGYKVEYKPHDSSSWIEG